jgi:hypothetical protein
VADPRPYVMVYRSAWSARILVGNEPFSPARIAALRRFCDERSFDVSYYQGVDVAAARAAIYNDLPVVSFTSGEVTSAGPEDAIADDAEAALTGASTEADTAFDLKPITADRPFYYAVLDLRHLGTILRRLEVLPQGEIASLVNLAVLAQAAVIAAFVLALPLFAPGRFAARAEGVVAVGSRLGAMRTGVYFAALGLGFLFIEILLIEKASFLLNDRASAFALVITAMLIFSGLGSLISERAGAAPRLWLAGAGIAIVGWCALMLGVLQPLLLAALAWPFTARVALLVGLIAPVAVALGMPFPLGLARVHAFGVGGLLPWAWALNGAFSVVATPLANLVALSGGFDRVLAGAALLYGIALLTFPSVRLAMARRSVAWQNESHL